MRDFREMDSEDGSQMDPNRSGSVEGFHIIGVYLLTPYYYCYYVQL